MLAACAAAAIAAVAATAAAATTTCRVGAQWTRLVCAALVTLMVLMATYANLLQRQSAPINAAGTVNAAEASAAASKAGTASIAHD
jgi:hypothetical protein